MTDVIEQRLRAAALGTPAAPPPLSDLRRRGARRRTTRVLAGVAAAAVVATGMAVLQPLDRTAASEVARTVEKDGLRLELRIADADLEVGDTLRAEFRATNTSGRPMSYLALHCGLGARTILDVALQPTGRSWDGPAGTFRDHVLAYPRFESIGSFGDGRPCTDTTLLEAELEPGASFSGTSTAVVTLSGGRPAGSGNVMVTVIDTTEGDMRDVRVVVPVRVTGSSPRLGPYEAVDAALSDPAFAAFLEAHPVDTRWGQAGAGLEGDRWRVGFFPMKSNTPLVSGHVVVDAVTGEVVERDLP